MRLDGLSRWIPGCRHRGRRNAEQARRVLRRALGLEPLETRRLLAVVTWDGGGDAFSWNDVANWVGDVLPGPADDVVIDVPGEESAIGHFFRDTSIRSLTSEEIVGLFGGSITLAEDSGINAGLVTTAGELIVGSDLTVGGEANLGGGTISGPGRIIANGGVNLDAIGMALSGITIDNAATLTWVDGSVVDTGFGATINNLPGATFNIPGGTDGVSLGGDPFVINNAGTLTKSGPFEAVAELDVLNNTGVVEIAGGLLAAGEFHQTAGELILSGGDLDTLLPAAIDGGRVSGSGAIVGGLTNAAQVSPGESAGFLDVDGDFMQTAAGTLTIEIGGRTASTDFDEVVVSGTSTLAGTLDVSLIDGFLPAPGDRFLILESFMGLVGEFDAENVPALPAGMQWDVEYDAAGGFVELVVIDPVFQPRQIIVADPAAVAAAPGGPVSLDVRYTTDPLDETLAGLGIRLHFDSGQLTFDSLDGVLPTGLIQQAVQDDTSNFDADPATDKFSLVFWTDLGGNWPGVGTLPALLFTPRFTATPAFTGTTLRFTASSTAVGYQLDAAAVPVTLAADPFTVTNTGDFGGGSLRQAILNANANAGTDTISFNIPGAGPHVISLNAPLPEVTDPIVIDATTEPDFAGLPVVELDGAAAGAGATGLLITAGDSTVRGLAINRFSAAGIELAGGGNNVIESNVIGLDASGSVARGNGGIGLWINGSPDNVIGGSTAAMRNVISANAAEGIAVTGAASTLNVIEGNYVGTDAAGTAAVGNGGEIGVAGAGIRVGEMAAFNTLRGNVVSGNHDAGVLFDTGAANNFLLESLVGVDAGGTAALPNLGAGVAIVSGAHDSLIQSNVIGGNQQAGVLIASAGATGNRVLGNMIGTDVTATIDLGNGRAGVHLEDGAAGNEIGTMIPGEENTIALNAAAGVNLAADAGTGNTIRANSIFGNAGLGIDLGGDGVTPGDPLDADDGPNRLLNFPRMVIVRDGATARVTGTFDGAPNTTFLLDFYAVDEADPSGHGEGRRWVDGMVLMTDAAGHADFDQQLTRPIAPTELMSSTTTDIEGNTSEFSQPQHVNPYPAGTIFWDGGGDGENWNDPANWLGDVLPGPADFAVIDLPAGGLVRHSAGDTEITALLSSHPILIDGGSISLFDSTSVLDADLTVDGEGLLLAELAMLQGTGTIVNRETGVVFLLDSRVDVDVDNSGEIAATGTNAINGALTTTFTSLITIEALADSPFFPPGESFSDLTFARGFTNNGFIDFRNDTGDETAAMLDILDGNLVNAFDGVIVGSGVVFATVISEGEIGPGLSPGVLVFDQDLQLLPDSLLVIEIGGTQPVIGHDLIRVHGMVTLDGTVDAALVDGFNPAGPSDFQFVTFGSAAGAGLTLTGLTGVLETDSTGVTLRLNQDSQPPTATLDAPDLNTAGGSVHAIVVTYHDDVGVDAATVDGDEISVIAPSELPLGIALADVRQDGMDVVATYHVSAPGGTWDAEDNGTYTVALIGGSVTDGGGNPIAGDPQFGDFDVNIPRVSVGDAQIVEGDDDVRTAVFTVSLSAATDHAVIVDFATFDDTATAGEDYTPQSDSVTIPTGQTSATIAVDVLPDNLAEGSETFLVKLTGAAGASVDAAADEGVGTIIDDDQPRSTASDVQIGEGIGAVTGVTVTLMLTQPSTQTVTIDFATVDVTTTAGEDYEPRSGTIEFPPGETVASFTITILDDLIAEMDETFSVLFSGAVNVELPPEASRAEVTILDDDDALVSIAGAEVVEGDAQDVLAAFEVTLSAVSDHDVTVHYRTVAGTATAGEDFTAATGSVVIPAGLTLATITVPARGDVVDELDEEFFVELTDVTGAAPSPGDDRATGRIIDNDTATLIFDDPGVVENDGPSGAVVTVGLSVPSDRTVTVDFSTANGTAMAGTDYVAHGGTLTFAPGEDRRTLAVSIIDDLMDEMDETFSVNFFNPQNVQLPAGPNSSTVTIFDDDQARLSIADVEVVEGAPGQHEAVFTVSLSAASDRDVSVEYRTIPGTATAGEDYLSAAGTVTIPAGGREATLAVTILGDYLDVVDEDFFVELAKAEGAVIAPGGGLATGTILNDDALLSITGTAVDEGDTGTRDAVFTLHLSEVLDHDVSVDLTTSGDTATPGVDFTATSGQVTIPAGQTQASFAVPVVGDLLAEMDEAFFVDITAADSAPIDAAARRAAGTIHDDDNVSLSIDDTAAVEGDDGDGAAVFTVRLSEPSPREVRVDFTTADGTALAGQDYQPTSGTLVFAAGETEKTITVPLVGDQVDEKLFEAFSLQLSAPQNAQLARTAATGTIVDDEVEVDEDSPATVLDFSAVKQLTPSLELRIVGNSNPSLFRAVAADNTAGTFTLDYAADAFGEAEITVEALLDGQSIATEALTVRVRPVNDRPTTLGIANFVVGPNPGVHVIDLFAAFDDLDDADAALTYTTSITAGDPLFTSAVVDPAAGTLTLTHVGSTPSPRDVTVTATDPSGASVRTRLTVDDVLSRAFDLLGGVIDELIAYESTSLGSLLSGDAPARLLEVIHQTAAGGAGLSSAELVQRISDALAAEFSAQRDAVYDHPDFLPPEFIIAWGRGLEFLLNSPLDDPAAPAADRVRVGKRGGARIEQLPGAALVDDALGADGAMLAIVPVRGLGSLISEDANSLFSRDDGQDTAAELDYLFEMFGLSASNQGGMVYFSSDGRSNDVHLHDVPAGGATIAPDLTDVLTGNDPNVPQVNRQLLDEIAAIFGGLPDGQMIVWWDPVDFELTNAQGLTNSHVSGVNNDQIAGTFHRANDFTAMLIVPGAVPDLYTLTLVGVGEPFRGAVLFVQGNNVAAVPMQGQLAAGERLVTRIDFRPAQPFVPIRTELAVLGFNVSDPVTGNTTPAPASAVAASPLAGDSIDLGRSGSQKKRSGPPDWWDWLLKKIRRAIDELSEEEAAEDAGPGVRKRRKDKADEDGEHDRGAEAGGEARLDSPPQADAGADAGARPNNLARSRIRKKSAASDGRTAAEGMNPAEAVNSGHSSNEQDAPAAVTPVDKTAAKDEVLKELDATPGALVAASLLAVPLRSQAEQRRNQFGRGEP